jgi:hypothetical protein
MKITLDFDSAEKAIDELKKVASDGKTTLASSENTVSGDLSGWKGNASASMDTSNKAAYNQLNDDFQTVDEVANYMQNYVNVVNEAESALSSLKI